MYKKGMSGKGFLVVILVLLVAVVLFLVFNTESAQTTLVNTTQNQLNDAYNWWKLKNGNITKTITREELKQLLKEKLVVIPSGYGVDMASGMPKVVKTLPTIEVGVIAQENSTFYGDIPTYINPVIPRGFKAVDTEVLWQDEDGWNKGLVIEDNSGNQYVWVPVNGRNVTLSTCDWVDNSEKALSETYTESPSKAYENETDMYNQMKESVQKYGGFYVARYEAGSLEATTIGIGRTDKTRVDTVAFQKNMIVYNMVEFAESATNTGTIGAKYLCENMYAGKGYGVISTLTYGCEFDAILKWIKTDENEYDITNAKSWGNYKNSTINDISKTAQYGSSQSNATYLLLTTNTKAANKSWLLTTGAAEALRVKNIYDLAGNVAEYTMEATNDGYRVARGGNFSVNTSSAGLRARASVYEQHSVVGFRACLYITEVK